MKKLPVLDERDRLRKLRNNKEDKIMSEKLSVRVGRAIKNLMKKARRGKRK